ncbi:MAG: hypothetical protein IKJ52_11050 [Muribaculaceae bacterium]|nr:hypothetical protein [Muribaculaceae bacterium]
MNPNRRIANTIGIYSLWLNWIIAVGALSILPIISLYTSKLLLPIIVFTLEVFLYILVRHNTMARMPSCMRLPHIVMVSLFWSGIVMLMINIYNSQTIIKFQMFSGPINEDIPYITLLIISPITFVVTLYNLYKGLNSNICRECRARNGNIPERGFLGKLYSQEGEFLSYMLMSLSLLLSILGWGYYFIFYINTNINDIDRFVFVWIQMIVFVVSIIYLGIKYWGLWLYYSQSIDGQSLRYNSSTLIRYIIICDDFIYLKTPNIDIDNIAVDETKIDTPARLYLKYKKNISKYEEVDFFKALSGISNVELRLLYKNNNFNTECNIFHYAYFVDDKSIIEKSRLEGEWYSFSQMVEMIKTHKLSPLFESELNRIYTIVMSWKTYDLKGKRLYAIKDYKPTFRLRDLKDCDVDYNDINWLYVSAYNADRPFFYVRNLWNKYICGIGLGR